MSKLENFGNKRNTNGFNKNKQNINRKGRPPKLTSHVLKELKKKGIEAITSAEINELYSMLINVDIETLNEYATDETMPAFVYTIANAILNDKSLHSIETIFDRVHGKATQKVETKQEVKQGIKINVVDYETQNELTKLTE